MEVSTQIIHSVFYLSNNLPATEIGALDRELNPRPFGLQGGAQTIAQPAWA